MKIEKTLLEKYNVPVPRYTSYPPANHFTRDIGAADHEALVRQSNDWDPRHIALYVHIPFCQKICFYCGCNACKLKSNDEVTRYIDALKQEIRLVARHIDPGRQVTQLHFGGGTPNSIPAFMLHEIVELFRSLLTFSDNAEIAIETNPAYLDVPYLDALIDTGFNRFSFGIQDLDKRVLKLVNREPGAMPVADLIAYVRKNSNQAAVNLDFIYGLPGQTATGFRRTMEAAAALGPDRLVTFSYAHVPWIKKHQQILEKRGLPSPEQKTAMFLESRKLLQEAGYMPVGLDHYVKPDDELFKALQHKKLHRNFQGYCTRETTGQVYAFGITGISQLEKAYIANTHSMEQYIEKVSGGRLPVEKGMQVSDREIVVREVITHLMCNRQLDWEALSHSLDVPADEIRETVGYAPERFGELVADRLVEVEERGLRVTEKGSMFIRNIAATLDPAYRAQVNKYSKAV